MLKMCQFKINSLSFISLFTISASMALLSCDDDKLDYQTLHFVTSEKIKTTLDLDLEIYRVDNEPKLFYLNFFYYKKNAGGQWAFSRKSTGPWKLYANSSSLPQGLFLLDK